MARVVKNRGKKKAGSPPGTLVYIGDRKVDNVLISIFEFTEADVQEVKIQDVVQCKEYLESPSITWINVDGLHDVELLRKLGENFSLHSLVLEDVLNTGQRPKAEEFDRYLFLVCKMLTYDRGSHRIKVEQVSFVLGDKFLISLQEDVGDVFDGIRQRLRTGKGRVRKLGADFLLYSMLDEVVDHYFEVLEAIGDDLESLEHELVDRPTPATLHAIYALKRELVYLRKAVWPLRECINMLLREDTSFIKDETRVFLRDLYDHIVHVIDGVETLRDLSAGMLDVYLSTVSNRMNEVMKVLTIMSSVFVPLTFIAGVYGMNFRYMPELELPHAYPMVLIFMTCIALGLLAIFRWKKWT